MKPSHCLCLLLHCLCLLFLVCILVASSAPVAAVSPNKETTWEKTRNKARAPVQLADKAFLAHLCDREQRRGRAPRILPWCTKLDDRRQVAHRQYQYRRLPMMPPPSRDDDAEQIDPRYGVSKRLVPSGPNRLHN